MLKKLINTDSSKTTIIIRLMVGSVFLSEGIQKFLFPAALGTGRFEKIGLPSAEFLVLIGLLTRFASIPLLIIMLVSITTTKLEILNNEGFWKMLHESRTDWAMLLGSLFLIIMGSGKFSVDRYLEKK
jgi:putative oxidoreductase